MNYESRSCKNCMSNDWEIESITWATNGSLVHKLKCKNCEDIDWVLKDFDIITIAKEDEENQLELMF